MSKPSPKYQEGSYQNKQKGRRGKNLRENVICSCRCQLNIKVLLVLLSLPQQNRKCNEGKYSRVTSSIVCEIFVELIAYRMLKWIVYI